MRTILIPTNYSPKFVNSELTTEVNVNGIDFILTVTHTGYTLTRIHTLTPGTHDWKLTKDYTPDELATLTQVATTLRESADYVKLNNLDHYEYKY